MARKDRSRPSRARCRTSPAPATPSSPRSPSRSPPARRSPKQPFWRITLRESSSRNSVPQLSRALSSSSPCRHPLLQLFCPVEHDDDLLRRPFALGGRRRREHDDELLAVW